MAAYLYRTDGLYHPRPDGPADGATHVAWALDDIPGLAAAIHATVLDLVVHGSSGPDVDTAILDCLRGTTPRAGDDPGAVHP